jgi:hypothetical protein
MVSTVYAAFMVLHLVLTMAVVVVDDDGVVEYLKNFHSDITKDHSGQMADEVLRKINDRLIRRTGAI